MQQLPHDERRRQRSRSTMKDHRAYPEDEPANGYTFLVIRPSPSAFGLRERCSKFKNIFSHRLWAGSPHPLDDLGQKKPKVFNGRTGRPTPTRRLPPCALPEGKLRGGHCETSSSARKARYPFEADGFTVTDSLIDGRDELRPLADGAEGGTPTALMADYDGA